MNELDQAVVAAAQRALPDRRLRLLPWGYRGDDGTVIIPTVVAPARHQLSGVEERERMFLADNAPLIRVGVEGDVAVGQRATFDDELAGMEMIGQLPGGLPVPPG